MIRKAVLVVCCVMLAATTTLAVSSYWRGVAVYYATRQRTAYPLLLCPCHLSVYDPLADGAPLAGPAPRGAFRFASAVVGDVLQVTAVEDGVIHVT